MNGKKAKLLRRLAGFDPKAEREFTPMRHGRRGRLIKGTHRAVGARRRYRLLKKAYREGRMKSGINY